MDRMLNYVFGSLSTSEEAIRRINVSVKYKSV